jgi:hypothetical protein
LHDEAETINEREADYYDFEQDIYLERWRRGVAAFYEKIATKICGPFQSPRSRGGLLLTASPQHDDAVIICGGDLFSALTARPPAARHLWPCLPAFGLDRLRVVRADRGFYRVPGVFIVSANRRSMTWRHRRCRM